MKTTRHRPSLVSAFIFSNPFIWIFLKFFSRENLSPSPISKEITGWREAWVQLTQLKTSIFAICIHTYIQSNLDYPDFSIIRTFSLVPLLSWIFIIHDLDPKPYSFLSDIRKSKEKIMTFADTCTGIHNGQWRCRPYCFPNNLQMFCFTIKCRFLIVISFCSSLIFIFSIIRTLAYPDYFVLSQRVRVIEVRLYNDTDTQT